MSDGPDRRTMLKLMAGAGVSPVVGSAQPRVDPVDQTVDGLQDVGPAGQAGDRAYWVETMRRVAEPLLTAMQARRLRASMPVEARPGYVEERRKNTHLEAVGRLIAGIAPWLELGPRDDGDAAEGAMRERFAAMARAGLESGVDPASADYLRFGDTPQSLVDAAFLSLGLLRAPTELWSRLSDQGRRHVVEALKATRAIKPPNNNWLLFAAMVEVMLRFAGEPWERARVQLALDRHESWYLGDGVYGDGPQFHFDYYNSFVIQPFLLQVMDREAKGDAAWSALQPRIEERAVRYAAIQERMISPEGTYPGIGRSLAYRCGAFHHLAEMSLRERLPQDVSAAQVRSALTAVMRRSLGAKGTFDAQGWLTIGFCGHQPDVAETYISTGSLYLCSLVFLPLGLPAESRFWSDRAAPWTSRKQWSGEDFRADHAL